MEDGAILKAYSVSTSKYGLGSELGSHKTPLGVHEIAEKIGEDVEVDTIFAARGDTGKIYDRSRGETRDDLVLTRILWLKGLEKGNANSHKRYIYIHGTPEEEKIGKPASHGCIRMLGKDVIELFEWVGVGTKVYIY